MKLSTAQPSQTRPQRRWRLILAALSAAAVAWGAAREIFLSRGSLKPVFAPLGQAISRLAGGDPSAGSALSKFVAKWGLTSLELLLAIGILALGIWITLAARRSADAPRSRLAQAILAVRGRSAVAGLLAALLIGAYPAFLLLWTYWGDVFAGPFMRLCLLLAAGLLAAACLPRQHQTLLDGRSVLLGLALVGGIFLIAAQLSTVTAYPFSLSWSEGNRLYENSIFFAGDRYQYSGELTSIRRATGRFLLWGLPFLIPDAPIWLHRLWNALISTLPHLALGLLLARRARAGRIEGWLFGLWAFLFLAQGPIYTPLIVSALATVAFVRPGKPIQSALAAGLAGYYASLSRWTWLPAVPAWTVFLLLADLGSEELPRLTRWRDLFSLPVLRRLAPVVVAGLAGLGGGLLANPKLFQPQRLADSTAMSQPLLWYRLWPSATYAEGVVPALIVACAPLVVLLIWLGLRGRWQTSWLQAAASLAACAVFLGGGLVSSVKIGGGNNLHNLDQFLVSLVILAGLALRDWLRLPPEKRLLPAWIRSALLLAVLLPAWTAIRSGGPLKLPPAETTRKAVESIRSAVVEKASQGEVLFLDQRQLLTFGAIEGVDLTPEYEKKYMMDQAMASDSAYFASFYRDLADGRFALIVSDIQFTVQKDSTHAFGEENNAWVQWVSQPLLCYYTPLRTLQNVNIQLLVPNPEAKDCVTP